MYILLMHVYAYMLSSLHHVYKTICKLLKLGLIASFRLTRVQALHIAIK